MPSADPLEGKSNEEVVGSFRRWAYHLANQYARPSDVDDVAQEALITIWRTLEAKGGKRGAAASLLASNGRYRAVAILGGAYPFGHDSKPGPRPEPKDSVTVPLLEAEEAPDEGGIDVLEMTNSMVEAILILEPQDREYVYSRFWLGMSDVEIAEERGTTNKVVGQNWHRRIKPVLATLLEDAA
jgi:DNA-directed RNA polymerase specialized sigma24 family protein